MGECKQINLGNIMCSDSAIDTVCQLVSKGMKVIPTCKLVAEQYAINFPEEPKPSWKALKNKYYTMNPTQKSSNIDSKSVTPPDTFFTFFIPTNSIYITISKYKSLQKICDMQLEVIDEYAAKEAAEREALNHFIAPKENIVEKAEVLLSRTEMDHIIRTFGTGYQPLILKGDDKPNAQYYAIVCAIRDKQLENKHLVPVTLPQRVLDATGYEPDEATGSIKSLPVQRV